MRIGIDASCWENRRGFGRFTRQLMGSLLELDRKNEYLFFADQDTKSIPVTDNVHLISTWTRVSPLQAASAAGRRSVRDVWAMTRQVLRHDLDLFFFPAVYSYFPVFNRAKVIVTIHDMIPEQHPEAVFPNKRLRLFWNLKRSLAVRQAHLIVTVSEHSKREIVEYCGVPESCVDVISEGPSDPFEPLPCDMKMRALLRSYQLEGKRFLLYVGGISPHKNLRTLLNVFEQLTADASYADVRLLLVGDYTGDAFFSDYPALKQQIERGALENRVHLTGYIEDKDLAYLYNAASMLVFPSLLEGFGLPAVEAMACGTPVVASNIGALPEILGGAGKLFNPYDDTEILGAIQQVLSQDQLRETMRQRGLVRAKKYTWEKGATELLTIFEGLVRN